MATITLLFMDAPYESSNSTTAMRIIDAALRKGHNVNVFAYEGAVGYTLDHQKHERRPLPKDWATQMLRTAAGRGLRVDWVRCVPCDDERGVHDGHIPSTRRGSPIDFWKQQVATSDNVLVIPAR